MLETDKGIPVLSGIPSYMSKPLARLIDQAKAQKGFDDNEVCGLFLFHATDWVPGTGWIGEIVYKAVPNLAATVKGGSGAFEMDPVAAAMHMSEAVDLREKVATAVCAREGWTPDTPWFKAVVAHTRAQLEAMASDNISIPSDVLMKEIARAVEEEMHDMCAGFMPYAIKAGFLSSIESSEPLGNGPMSAHTWLMARGVTVLCGIAHSHPSGVSDISPEDFLAGRVVEQWKSTFQVRFATEGQKTDSQLELPRSVGNWVYALPEGGTGQSTLVRYDLRGIRGKWSGPF